MPFTPEDFDRAVIRTPPKLKGRWHYIYLLPFELSSFSSLPSHLSLSISPHLPLSLSLSLSLSFSLSLLITIDLRARMTPRDLTARLDLGPWVNRTPFVLQTHNLARLGFRLFQTMVCLSGNFKYSVYSIYFIYLIHFYSFA